MKKSVKIILILGLSLVFTVSAALLGWYWYDNNVDRSGWEVTEGVYSYRDFYGDYVSGWQEIDGHTYYFFPDSFAMATNWQTFGVDKYYFSGDGTLDTGFWDIDGGRYYFAPDGRMSTGWVDVGEHRYYFDDQGKMRTSWLTLEGERYYLGEDGAMAVGLTDLEGKHYQFEEDGTLYTGWDLLEGELVYYTEEGPRATGWQLIDQERYYFGEDGVMETGWITQGENRYYLTDRGPAAVGPTQIDGTTYYFSPQGIHVVLVNSSHPVPDDYTMELKTVEKWNQVSTVCYDQLVKMLEDCVAAGHKYNFNSSYRSVAQQQEILSLRTQEYMDQDPEMSYQAAYSKARQTVALPGTSEHHLGLAVDLLGDDAIAWFHEHCWEYGFIVRYRAEKSHITGIIDEPWHFRYVGVDVAMDMKDSPLCLEEYLGAVEIEEPAQSE